MPFAEENAATFLTLLSLLSRVKDSFRTRLNNGTERERGFLAPYLRFLDNLFHALSENQAEVELGQYGDAFMEEIGFYAAMIAGVDWQWSNFSHLLPEDYDEFLRTLAKFVRAYREQCK